MGCLRCCCVVLCCLSSVLLNYLSSIFMYMLHSMYTYTHTCTHCVFNIRILGMPVVKDPFFKRYISNSGLDHVEPLFRQLKNDRPDLQLVMVILPGKTPVYGTLCPSLSFFFFLTLTPPLPFLPPTLPPLPACLPTPPSLFLSLSPSLSLFLPLLPSCMSSPPLM